MKKFLDKIIDFFKTNPLWVIVILLIVMIFQIQMLVKNTKYLQGYLSGINEELGWIRTVLGKPSEEKFGIGYEGINDRLIEILSELENISYKLR